MDAHTHESGESRLQPATAPPVAGPAERALASALRTVFGALRLVMVLVLIALVFSNTRFLRQNQRAVILRFGKIVGTGAGRVHGPGLVLAWPQPIDEIIVVDAKRTQTLTIDDFMFRPGAREGGTEDLGPTLDPALDGYTVTGDANIIHTVWTIKYEIKDVVDYVLNVADPEALIHSSLAAAVVHTSAEFTVTEALWGEGLELRSRVWKRLQERLDEAKSGIAITDVNTPTRREPKQTTDAFHEFQQAVQERDKTLQDAQRYQEQVLAAAAGDAAPQLVRILDDLAKAEEAPEAERDQAKIDALRAQLATTLNGAAGEVAQTLSDAKAYAFRVEKDAESMALTFGDLNEKWKQNPGIFTREMYRDAIQEVLAKAGYTFAIRPGKEVRITVEPPRKEKKPPEQAQQITRTKEEQMRTGPMGR
jgi:membrane protease subunit HflK